jgi:hypothetical protein
MSDALVNKTDKASPTAHALRGMYCDSISFEFRVTLDKFDLANFKKPFDSRFKEPLGPGVAFSAMFSTLDPKMSDYHVHLDWNLVKNRIDVTVSYYSTAIAADKDEKEPFAENAMAWLGKFFKADNASAHVHANFEYPVEKWRFLVPLPISMAAGSKNEVEIDGMSFSLQKQPLGMAQAWIVSREKTCRVLLYGDRPVHFDSFDILREVGQISEFAKSFVREASREVDKH